ncbi:MAG TPA: response regulator [Candidatus Saccharimonadales bacterium]|nr:response regulator [Candidatus Saccharimonadales bacterium]
MTSKKPTIMVIEDEDLLLRAITKALDVLDVDVLSCRGAKQALDYLDKIDTLPDAIWLDYYLKDMNGLVFMQQLKNNPQWAGVPVVVVSNSASHEKVKQMMDLGAKKYILKAEYQLDEIVDMIRPFMRESV